MYKRVVLCFLLVFAFPVSAAEWQGHVTEVKASIVSKTVLFKLSGDLKAFARCNESGMYAVDLKKAGGEIIFDLLKYAAVNNLPLKAYSLNACHSYWKAENVKELVLMVR